MKATLNIISILALFITLPLLSTCSTSQKKQKIHHVGHEQKVDAQKISENLQYEKASKPTKEQMKRWAKEEENCTVMSKIQMQRSGASGCNPVDPRMGHGEGMVCCTKD